MNVGYLIIGRLKSTRLPKKILLKVKNRPFLAHMVDRIKLSKKTNVVVLCTSTNTQDDPVKEFAEKNAIECFRGDEDDVIKRLFDASKAFDLDYILTMTADCPLVDPVYADKIVEAFEKTGADLIRATNLPHGAYTHGIKPSALQKIMEIKDTSDTEVWPRYFTDTGLFRTHNLSIQNPKHKRRDLRLTLDYPEDYKFFKALFNALYKPGGVFNLDEIIDFLDARPDIVSINKDCEALYEKRVTRQSEIKLKQRHTVKKIAIFGCGSIGQRHIQNLRKLGYSKIGAFRTQLGHFKVIPSDIGIQELCTWNEVLDFKPDVAIIANPTSLHLETAIRIAPYVKGIFVEKPLSHSQEKIDKFIELVKSKNIVTFVGYNLHFHPITKIIKEEMQSNNLGEPIVFQCQVGQWLPDWHPYEDFQKAYCARKDLGGGVTLTMIHEINLAQELFGQGIKTVAFLPKSKKLALDVDIIADIMIYHEKNTVSQIHLDYIQHPMSRSGSISFERGWLRYDLIHSNLMIQSESEKVPQILWNGKNYDPNEMYQDEMRLFMQYVSEGRIRHTFDIWNATRDLALVEAAFESEKTEQIINISDFVL